MLFQTSLAVSITPLARLIVFLGSPPILQTPFFLLRSRRIFALPGAGNGPHSDYLELYEKIQKSGKAVAVGGTVDEVKFMHKRLQPEKTMYDVTVSSEKEAYDVLKWFRSNT